MNNTKRMILATLAAALCAAAQAEPLALDTSTLATDWNEAGISTFKCRSAFREFEKAVSDANVETTAKREKLDTAARGYLKSQMERAQTAGDLDKVLAFKTAIESIDGGKIVGDDDAITKLRESCTMQLAQIDRELMAAGANAAQTLVVNLDWQKKEATKKGDFDEAQKISDFQKKIEEWKTMMRGQASQATTEQTATTPRPHARPPQPTRKAKLPEPEAKTYTIDAKKAGGIGMAMAGDTIAIRYVSGKWFYGGGEGLFAESPDGAETHEVHRCVLCGPGNLKLATLPGGTIGNPFRYTVDESDAGSFYLAMADAIQGRGWDNAGQVRYSVKIIPGEASIAAANAQTPVQPSMRRQQQTATSMADGAKIVTIDASDRRGAFIGVVKAGDTIEIQYVQGRWHDGDRGNDAESPDDTGTRLRCVLAGPGNLKLAPIPSGTKATPFQYIVDDSDAGSLFLIMEDAITSNHDNTGQVRYSVRVIPTATKEQSSARQAVPASPSTVASRTSNRTLSGTQAEASLTLAKTPLPHVVKGQYVVPGGKRLIVEAGATIVFERDASLNCKGNLTMNGTETAPVICKGHMPNAGYWDGITIQSRDSHLNYVQVECAKTALTIQDGVRVENCSFKKCNRTVEWRYWSDDGQRYWRR